MVKKLVAHLIVDQPDESVGPHNIRNHVGTLCFIFDTESTALLLVFMFFWASAGSMF